ncbi:MAG TPA: DUF5069 domain-containing protein [Candidatus Elarobacter sp.]|jgi:hypothetical protein|nr:DUF5069 domain-containing protein [Candidatus Elarobacter sp.]
MEPLSFASQPPRGPREKLAGIVFTARVVDKLRASLPGGELNGYIAYTGMSVAWRHYTKIDLAELCGVVESAQSEAEVEAWIEARTAHLDKAKINEKLERFDSSRMPDDLRPLFERLIPAELRERYPLIFDLLEADDARLYPATDSGRKSRLSTPPRSERPEP